MNAQLSPDSRRITVRGAESEYPATLTWWHRGWLEYALRLDGPAGSVEAVEDSWFAAAAAIGREMAAAGYRLPVPEVDGPATSPEEHHARWVRWLAEGFPTPR